MAATNNGAVSWFESVLKVALRHMLRGRPFICQVLNERVQGSKNISLSIHNTKYDGIYFFFSGGEDSCMVLDQHTAPYIEGKLKMVNFSPKHPSPLTRPHY